MTSRDRLIPIDGTANLRDLGGYRADGGTTKWGELYRSDGLHLVSDTGRRDFASLGVTRVIDLRDDQERAIFPDGELGGAAVIPFPIFASAHAHVSENMGIERLTELIYQEHGDTLAGAIALIADEVQGATLFHCTAGKDRTGAVAALTLTALGVDRDDVLHDYAVTEQNLSGMWVERHLKMLSEAGVELTPELLGLISGSPIPALDRALTDVERQYGSVRDYLITHGLGTEQIERLHLRFVTGE